MTDTGGMFGVPKEVIPDDLYTMLVRAKTRNWQQDARDEPFTKLPPDQLRRNWVVDRLIEIRGYPRPVAENYYDRFVCGWLEA